MFNVGNALTGLFYVVMIITAAAFFLGIYVLLQAVFSSTPWEVCAKMETDAAKVQCMEAHYE